MRPSRLPPINIIRFTGQLQNVTSDNETLLKTTFIHKALNVEQEGDINFGGDDIDTKKEGDILEDSQRPMINAN